MNLSNNVLTHWVQLQQIHEQQIHEQFYMSNSTAGNKTNLDPQL
eukprot:COSAG06_NODE_42619_length_380_cov_0.572954_1_plen_43_part_10